MLKYCCDPLIRENNASEMRGKGKRFAGWISLLIAIKYGGGYSMEGDGLRAEGEFLVLSGFCRKQLRFWLLDFILDGYLRV